MATFLLIHGGGDVGWYWHLVEERLRAHGHRTFAPDLPDDDSATLDDYVDAATAAVADHEDLVIVGHSYGAYTATLAAQRLSARLLVLLAGMIPAPGESPNEWWANTGYRQAVEEQAALDGGRTGNDDPFISFYNGVPRPIAEEAMRRASHRGESSTVAKTPWPLPTWPSIPTRVILCEDDKFFPAPFLRRLTRSRLALTPDEVPGGHCAALSHPAEITNLLLGYLA
ncbi:alpha/beta hydrolase [Nocardia yunnanensis]|uniref:Alpha/beta hydrolase n=1 Tax=Nocardia yunnanensis TaxID=2382165 RepID=A0A386ZH45_9NOCA|nr:alpha/beta hydrolase [Nocardia yunnanensis]AYF76847.1 alpha/beta hydrolase [Nocardia yunnanensis]